MKIFFTHTHNFRFHEGNYYSTGGLNNKALKRYSVYASELVVGARVTGIDFEKAKKLSVISEKNISFLPISYNLKMFSRIKNAVKESDYVVARFPSVFAVIAVFYAKKYNKIVLSEVVGNAFEALWFHSFKGKLIAYPFSSITKWAIFKSDYISYITKEYLQKIYLTKGITANGLANISLSDSLFNEDLVLKNRLSRIENNAELKIGMIGNLQISYKGHELILKVFSQLIVNYPNITLDLVGDGNPDKIISIVNDLGISENVKISGTIPNEKIFEWFDTVDIYVQPSKTEAHGRSLIEAMSRGCSVVSSDVGGMTETVPESFRFPLNDLRVFYNMIDRLLVNSNERVEQAYLNYYNSQQFKESTVDLKRKDFFDIIFLNPNKHDVKNI